MGTESAFAEAAGKAIGGQPVNYSEHTGAVHTKGHLNTNQPQPKQLHHLISDEPKRLEEHAAKHQTLLWRLLINGLCPQD